LDSIFLNVFHLSNFLIDPKTKEIKVVDLDSCRICDSKPFPARYLTPLSLLTRAPGKNKYDIFRKDLLKKVFLFYVMMQLLIKLLEIKIIKN